MSYAPHFSLFLQREPQPLYFAAHRLHPLPDAAFDAQQQALLEGAAGGDAQQRHIHSQLLPRALAFIATALGDVEPERLRWASSAEALLTPLLDAAPLRMLCMEPLPRALAPTLRRLQRRGVLQLETLQIAPYRIFAARWSLALQRLQPDYAALALCDDDRGAMAAGVAGLLHAARLAGARPLLDLSAGFMGLDTRWVADAGALDVVAEAPPYAMSGGGYAFALSEPATPAMAVSDPSALYRFVAVQEWLNAEGLTPDKIHAHIGSLQARFLSRLDALRLPLSGTRLQPPVGAARGNFLHFELADADPIQRALAAAGIITAATAEGLDVGFGIFNDAADVDALLARLPSVLGHVT